MSKFETNRNECKLLEKNGSNLMIQIYNCLKNEWISECRDLCEIIGSPHMRALVYAADCIARNDYKSGVFAEEKQIEDNVDSVNSQILKIVRVVKNDEPLGATVKIDELSGAVVLARVLVGGAAHRSGVINVGDHILEVNGISVRGRSPVDVIHLLERNCREGVICFKLLAADKWEPPLKATNLTVRAHFDYDPSTDPYIPCGEIGLPFKRGDILNVVNREDANWWQASKLPDPNDQEYEKCWQSFAGLIPGQQLQERRLAAMRDLKTQYDRNRYIEIMPGLKSPFRKAIWMPRKVKKVMYDLCHNFDFDREMIATYEPVAKYYPRPKQFRPIVLIGPTGVGRKTLIKLLLEHRPNHFRRPIPHTTRFKRFSENDGIDYHFVADDWMESEIKSGNFIEFGEFKGNYYGIHKESVHHILSTGFVCLLNLSSQGLKRIYTSEFKPYIVFVRPSYDLKRLIASRIQKCDKSLSNKAIEEFFHSMIFGAHKQNYLYGQYFDTMIINDELRTAFTQLLEVINSLETEPKWVPIGWVHSS